MKFFSLGIIGMMVLVALGYMSNADELHEADLRDAKMCAEVGAR